MIPALTLFRIPPSSKYMAFLLPCVKAEIFWTSLWAGRVEFINSVILASNSCREKSSGLQECQLSGKIAELR